MTECDCYCQTGTAHAEWCCSHECSNPFMMPVYAFEYNSCVFEGGYSIQSLHMSKRNAFKEMVKHRNERWYQDRERVTKFQVANIGWMEGWRIRELVVLP